MTATANILGDQKRVIITERPMVLSARSNLYIYLVPPSVDVFLPIDDPKKQLKDKTVLRIEAVLNKLAVLKK